MLYYLSNSWNEESIIMSKLLLCFTCNFDYFCLQLCRTGGVGGKGGASPNQNGGDGLPSKNGQPGMNGCPGGTSPSSDESTIYLEQKNNAIMLTKKHHQVMY
jgi:hypothetical protein